jgi:hypothetical protein
MQKHIRVVVNNRVVDREATESISKEICIKKHSRNCPKCGYVEPTSELMPQLEGNIVIIKHINAVQVRISY